jgi:hypothetical protein
MLGKKKEPVVKAPTPREILAARIAGELEQMVQGQSLVYKLPQEFWKHFGGFIIVELNSTYPGKGKKYCTYVDYVEEGKPAGKRRDLGQNNKTKEIADWIAESEGPFGSLERYQ